MSSSVDRAIEALRDSRLYADPTAVEQFADAGVPFDEDDQNAVRGILNGASTPIMLAVLPRDTPSGTAGRIARGVDRSGTYVAIIPPNGESSAISDILVGVDDAARSAAGQSTNIVEFAQNVVTTFAGLPRYDTNGRTGGSGDGDGGFLPLAILAAIGGGGLLLYRRNKRQRELAELAQVRGALDEDITAYGEELSDLDLNLSATSAVPAEAQREYTRALDLYEEAKGHTDRAERPSDLRRVTHALEEGRWLLSCVRARLAGDPAPQRRLPCFFDPRHGPSVEDLEWAPPGGVPRNVPACAADAVRIRSGADPDIRMVTAGGQRRPYWDAGPAYGGWAGGYFGGFLPGMLMGTMLGSAFSAPGYAGGDFGADAGGDVGGGDFGGGFGGDFGGGFGGGDFGGGFGG